MTDNFDDRGTAGTPTLYSLDKSVAILRTELKGFMGEMNRRIDVVDGTIKESLGKYATVEMLKERDEQIADIRSNIKWAARLIVGAVILAALTLIFKSGLVHT